MTPAESVDFIVVGAGMAGASVAAKLALHGRVVVLEAEAHAGYHSTGRSAALYSQAYGNATVRALTRASWSFFVKPPEGFAPAPLLRLRDTMFPAAKHQGELLEAFRADPMLHAHTILLDARAAASRVPILQRDLLAGAVLDPTSADIDVDLLLQGFLRQARSRGAQVLLNAAVTEIAHQNSAWTVRTATHSFQAPIVVNAAGAWANELAALAGVGAMPLQPMRRTAALIAVPEGLDASDWPAVIAIDESFYFKPDAGLLLISPADEHPSPACDAQPEELDVAIAVDRFETATGRQVRQVKHQWAGLRVFSPDRTPVIGFDADAPGFFWCAGQGGYGIQTAPCLGRVAAKLALGKPLPEAVAALGVQAQQLSPRRFASAPLREA